MSDDKIDLSNDFNWQFVVTIRDEGELITVPYMKKTT